jgi:hypothetical protein
MRPALILAVSLTLLACLHASTTSPKPQENVIILKHLRATLNPNWIILNHVPNGEYTSLVSAALTDEQGKPKDDKSMILFGVWDVSGHDGLTMFQLMTTKHEKKNERRAGEWVINFVVEQKKDGYALVVDGLKYVEEHKCYLWVRRGRKIETPTYTLADSDLKDILTFIDRVNLIERSTQTAASKQAS